MDSRYLIFNPPFPAPLPNLVWIPPGTFTLGSPPNEQDRSADEGPQTRVLLTRGFFLGKYEVTQREYQDLIGSNPSSFKGDLNLPVERVSWDDAMAYCRKLTDRERSAGRLPAGHEYRLPTEAQWEYACRAGTTTRFSFGDDPNYSQLGSYAWYSSSQTHAVGTRLPNPWGLYDMHGNVLEWCYDWHGAYPGGNVTDPTGLASGSYRVFRGGGWSLDGRYCRSAGRGGDVPSGRSLVLGFRVALVPVP
ncbi:MAG: formylglycine-generating enzyme family protein [Verrucomicrobia bacterium]|nr:formylglycine-generating enzyme family protein [Verrucomicrobiota bacterium]